VLNQIGPSNTPLKPGQEEYDVYETYGELFVNREPILSCWVEEASVIFDTEYLNFPVETMIDLAIKEKATAFITNRHIAYPKKIYDIPIFQTESETFKLAHSMIRTNSKFKPEGINNETLSRNNEVSEKQQETQGSKDLVLPSKVLEEEEKTQPNKDNSNTSKPQNPTDTTSISSWAYSQGVSPDVIDKLIGMGVETLEDAVAILCSQYESDEDIQANDSKNREEIFPSDLSLKNMDISGLDEELGTVFRRVFPSRTLSHEKMDMMGQSHVRGLLLLWTVWVLFKSRTTQAVSGSEILVNGLVRARKDSVIFSQTQKPDGKRTVPGQLFM
jgi:hypothetical protein